MVPAFVVTGLGLLKEGVQTNWWGLACPAHCQGSGAILLLAIFVAGWLSGALCALLAGAQSGCEAEGRTSPGDPPPNTSSPSSTGSFTLVELPPDQASSSLAGYLPELQRLSPRVLSAPPPARPTASPPPFPSSFVVPEYPLQGSSAPPALEQPADPPAFIAETARFLSACNLSPRSRITRAWRAGVSAGKVLSGVSDYADKTPKLTAKNRIYCVLRTRAVKVPAVYKSFAEYSAVPGILERLESSLVPASSGVVELLELVWPPVPDPDGQRSCVCYALLLRSDGFLLCVPEDFFLPGELESSEEDVTARPGPSHRVQASAVALSEDGEWRTVPDREPIPALVVDFPSQVTPFLTPLDPDVFVGSYFVDAEPTLYPLAAEVLVQARHWILNEGGGPSSGYQTAVSEVPVPAPSDPKRGSRPKRPTMAQLAQQQASLTEMVARISDQLEALRTSGARSGPQAQALGQQPTVQTGAQALVPSAQAAAPRQELQAAQEGAQVQASAAHVGVPQHARQAAQEGAQLAAAITSGELPDMRPQDDLTAAMVAQSRALLTLVGQMAQAGDPILDPSSSSSVSARGSQTRQRLQAELAQHTGGFAEKLKERALARMAPAGVGSTEPFSLCRYHESFGGYAKFKEQGLVAWQVAIAFDLLMSGNTSGAADSLALLALYLDQATLDQGSTTIAWLLTLLQDPPQSLFTDSQAPPGISVQPFSQLADQKWITSALGFLKEMDLIATRRQEAKAKPKKPPGVPPPPALTEETGGPVGSKEGGPGCRKRCGKVGQRASSACLPSGPTPLDFDGEFSFSSWANSLIRLVLKSGTSFGHFLSKTLHLHRSDDLAAPTALFPLPAPFPSPIGGMTRRRGGSRRTPVHLKYALHVLTMGLNFVHSGGHHVPPHVLRRPPAPVHLRVFRRLSGFLRACCRRGAVVPFCAGRRGAHLVARQNELIDFLAAAGLGASSYDGLGASLGRVPHSPLGPESLRPFQALQADSMVLHGEANWDIGPYLDPSMLMAFKDPLVLEFAGTGGPKPSFARESPAELMKLMLVWDAKSLLSLRPGPVDPSWCSRIFGSFKGPGKFRQIGDRRGPNSYEAKLEGVSHELPQGFLLTRVSVPRFSHQLLGSTTDRKDFYSQCGVSYERACSNAVRPIFRLGDFLGTKAFEKYVACVRASTLPPAAFAHSRCPPDVPRAALLDLDCPVHGCFSALFQGDASGVEFATAAHANFLALEGVLPSAEHGRLLAQHSVSRRGPWTGVVIDDFFFVSCEEIARDRGHISDSERIVRRAKKGYHRLGVKGSDDKDLFSSETFTVAGAECDSSLQSVREGLVSVASPVSKRLALSLVSLRSAAMRWATEELISQLAGGWVSVLMFRRCAMALTNKLFSLGVSKPTGEAGSALVPLTPQVRQELALLAVFAPVLATNVAAPYAKQIFASDASLGLGAYTSARVPEPVAASVWLSSDSKGFYTKLEDPWRAALSALSCEPLLGCPDTLELQEAPNLRKPVSQCFDFLVAGPAPVALVTRLSSLGFVGGPVLDATASRHLDLREADAIEWGMHLLMNDRLGALVVYLPSGALSVLHASSSAKGNLGPTSKRSSAASRLASGACALFWVAWRCRVPAVLVCGGMAASRYLGFVEKLDGVRIRSLPACSFGHCHRGSVTLYLSDLRLVPVAPPSSCVCQVPKNPSPGHCPTVIELLVSGIASSLRALPPRRLERKGLESLIVNDLLCTAKWRSGPAWHWAERSHINVLEAEAYVKVLRDLAVGQGDLRYTHVVDSSVTLGATSKGRSSTRALRHVLQQNAALQIAGGLYPSVTFGPTRLNIADDPTRLTNLRPPQEHSLVSLLGPGDLYLACTFKQLRRPLANFLRLACLLVGFRSPRPLGGFLRALTLPWRKERWFAEVERVSSCARSDPPLPFSGFDATLGFPGEGPLLPRERQDVERQQRRAGSQLPSGRPVQPRTRTNRETLLRSFQSWLQERGSSLEALEALPLDPAIIGRHLTTYGRELFDSGRPYWHFSETVNAIAARIPSVRRQLQEPWDLAFSWLALEPYTHHVPMPLVLLLATLSCCLIWGWKQEAGIFALAWGGVLRIGEATQARRADLILPSDVLGLQQYILLRICEPKTRLRTARHQSAKVEPSDLVRLITLAFEDTAPSELLWKRSSQTLRRRLDLILGRLGVVARSNERAIDLGSFRPGGATHLLQLTEDSELVRRRGRWASHRVMEIYLQEIASIVFLPRQPLSTRQRILSFAQAFPGLLDKAEQWTKQQLPPQAWFSLFSASS
ncbi:unnamed protein product [Symbiodinium sp. CCMP2592]|nr:unnamed protein product [Symbiodinium sp. CCMP2592]